MALDIRFELLDQLTWHWTSTLRPRLDGLTDDELHWEPAPGAWGVRPREEARTSIAAGVGPLVIEFEPEPPSPTPVTTIAWRLGHLLVGIFEQRLSAHFGDGSVTYASVTWPTTADEWLARLDDAYARWVDAVGRVDLAAQVGPAEGPFAERTWAALVLHINREVIHHGAEVALLRDLWAHRRA